MTALVHVWDIAKEHVKVLATEPAWVDVRVHVRALAPMVVKVPAREVVLSIKTESVPFTGSCAVGCTGYCYSSCSGTCKGTTTKV